MTIKDLIQELLEYPLDTPLVMGKGPLDSFRHRYVAEVQEGWYRPISNSHGVFFETGGDFEHEGGDVKCVSIWPVAE